MAPKLVDAFRKLLIKEREILAEKVKDEQKCPSFKKYSSRGREINTPSWFRETSITMKT